MRMTPLACVLLLFPGAILAQDPPQPPIVDPTLAIPKEHPLVVRLPSPERMDALGKQFHSALQGLVPAEVVAILKQGGASGLLLAETGLAGRELDRNKPVYLVPTAGGLVAIASSPGKGATATGPAKALQAEKRAAPTKLLAGDLALHFYASETTAAYKQQIDQALEMASTFANMSPVPLPDAIKLLIQPMVELAGGAVYGVESVDYALILHRDWIESRGRVATRPGSGFFRALARAGEPGDHSLAGMLPKDALIFADSWVTPDWPSKELTDFFEAKLGGNGIGRAIGSLMGIDFSGWGITTGRSAAAVQLVGMQGGVSLAVHELMPGMDDSTVVAKFGTDKLNELMQRHKLPITYKLTPEAARHGETRIHRVDTEFTDPMLANMAQGTYLCFAVEGSYLVLATSVNAIEDIKGQIDRVRAGPVADHPHLKAMARLGAKRHTGISFNVGALKAFAPLAFLAAPEAGRMLGALPDRLLLSTAITIRDGALTWRGDWPTGELIRIIKTVQGIEAGGKPKPPPDEDFD